jgi:leucyl-tRNA synthetase
VDGFVANAIDELQVFEAAKDFFGREFHVAVKVLPAEGSNHPKARLALPYKPAIVIG